ncbi:unnamed protein product [Schistocephalus solidus]|uniref:Uncharacterized protein n=1 Tax=Schistocephalus solidus TaxID=70667 RepID=A0A183SEU2_SCHSO|nr:unnamed protein product [Schistocephalus solidus]
MRQVQATPTDVVSKLEKNTTVANVRPSALRLPWCTIEVYDDFIRQRRDCLCAYLSDRFQIKQPAIVGGRIEADFIRTLLTVLLGPLVCRTFCWVGGSKDTVIHCLPTVPNPQRLDMEISFANKFGLHSATVMTGVTNDDLLAKTRRAEGKGSCVPDVAYPSVMDIDKQLVDLDKNLY